MSLWIQHIICKQTAQWVIEYAHDVVIDGDSFLDQSPKRRHQRYKARPFPCNKLGSCRTGDVTARPIPKKGRAHRSALQFSSPAFLIVEESREQDNS